MRTTISSLLMMMVYVSTPVPYISLLLLMNVRMGFVDGRAREFVGGFLGVGWWDGGV